MEVLRNEIKQSGQSLYDWILGGFLRDKEQLEDTRMIALCLLPLDAFTLSGLCQQDITKHSPRTMDLFSTVYLACGIMVVAAENKII